MGAEPRWWGRSLGDHGDEGGDKIKIFQTQTWQAHTVQTEPTKTADAPGSQDRVLRR